MLIERVAGMCLLKREQYLLVSEALQLCFFELQSRADNISILIAHTHSAHRIYAARKGEEASNTAIFSSSKYLNFTVQARESRQRRSKHRAPIHTQLKHLSPRAYTQYGNRAYCIHTRPCRPKSDGCDHGNFIYLLRSQSSAEA